MGLRPDDHRRGGYRYGDDPSLFLVLYKNHGPSKKYTSTELYHLKLITLRILRLKESYTNKK
jgi:hypothetical protein